jgi:hypothetical protein
MHLTRQHEFSRIHLAQHLARRCTADGHGIVVRRRAGLFEVITMIGRLVPVDYEK